MQPQGWVAPSRRDPPELLHSDSLPPTLIGSHDKRQTGQPHLLLFLQGLQEEGLDLGAQMEALRPLIQGNPSHQHKMDQLSTSYQALQRSLEVNQAPGILHSGVLPLPFLFLPFLPIPSNLSVFLFSFLSSLPHSPSRWLLSTSCMPGSVLGRKAAPASQPKPLFPGGIVLSWVDGP